MLQPILIAAGVGGVLALILSLNARRSHSTNLLAETPLAVMFGLSAGAVAGAVLPSTPVWSMVQAGEEGQVISVKSISQFDQIIADADTPVLVDFYADWCPPCRQQEPHLREFASSRAGRVTVVSVDVDDLATLAQRHGVRAIPTLVVYSEGRVVRSRTGMHDVVRLGQLVGSAL